MKSKRKGKNRKKKKTVNVSPSSDELLDIMRQVLVSRTIEERDKGDISAEFSFNIRYEDQKPKMLECLEESLEEYVSLLIEERDFFHRALDIAQEKGYIIFMDVPF